WVWAIVGLFILVLLRSSVFGRRVYPSATVNQQLIFRAPTHAESFCVVLLSAAPAQGFPAFCLPDTLPMPTKPWADPTCFLPLLRACWAATAFSAAAAPTWAQSQDPSLSPFSSRS